MKNCVPSFRVRRSCSAWPTAFATTSIMFLLSGYAVHVPPGRLPALLRAHASEQRPRMEEHQGDPVGRQCSWGGRTQDHGLHTAAASAAGTRPQHPPLSLRRGCRSHHVGARDARAELHNHPRGVQAEPAATLRTVWSDRYGVLYNLLFVCLRKVYK